jgi:hypothetical protein
VGTPLSKKVGDLLARLEKSPESQCCTSSSFSVLRYIAGHEPAAYAQLTTPKAIRIIWDTMQVHSCQNDVWEDGLAILMHLTKKRKDREVVRQALPVYALDLLDNLKKRTDEGSQAFVGLESLIRLLGGVVAV